MEDGSSTQKQRSLLYSGNLGYFRRAHYLRRLRMLFTLTAAIAAAGTVATYRFWKNDDAFSKGALSLGHATLVHDCRACHPAAETDPLRLEWSGAPDAHSFPGLVRSAFTKDENANGAPNGRPPGAAMDVACLQCHPTFGNHGASGNEVFESRAVPSPGMSVTNCFVCHREHEGPARMALPASTACVSCHADSAALAIQQRASYDPVPSGKAIPPKVATRISLSNERTTPLAAFRSFAEGHPRFPYEHPEARDSAAIRFNHAVHLRADLSGTASNRTLQCTECHTPSKDRKSMEPIHYEQHCGNCHSLQISPSLPKLQIPHGDSEKVRWFLASIRIPILNAIKADPSEADKRADAEMEALGMRGLRTLAEFEQRVFFDGDPRTQPSDRRMRAGNAKFLTECAKCHTVEASTPEHAPAIQPARIPDRWLSGRTFSHRAHEHMDCTDCHGSSAKSTLTSDILLPSRESCTACHRPPLTFASDVTRSSTAPHDPHSASAQRERGGVKWDCQTCHGFHAHGHKVSDAPR